MQDTTTQPPPATSNVDTETQISVSGIPADLLADIDALAEADDRSRSVYIRRILAEKVAEIKARK